MGIERVRYRGAVYPGDVVEIEALVKRLRSRMGVLTGRARVRGKVVAHGTMTFALGPRTAQSQPDAAAPAAPRAHARERRAGATSSARYKELRPIRSGELLLFTLQDATGQIHAKLLDDIERFKDEFEAGEFVRVEARAHDVPGPDCSSPSRTSAASTRRRIACRGSAKTTACCRRRGRSTRCGPS